MFINESKRLKMPFLSSFFVSMFVFCNAYAGQTEAQTAKAQMQGQAIAEAEKKSNPVAEDYRQRLSETVVIQEERFPNEVDSYVRYIPSRGAGAQSGSVGIVDSAAEYSYQIKAFGKLPVQLGVSSEYIGIRNTTVVKLPAHLTSIAFGMETTVPFFGIDKTYFTVGLLPSFATENWSLSSSALSLNQRYFLIYQPDAKWTFICGVAIWPHHDKDAMPIIGFIYKPNNRLTFNIIPRSPEISYALTQKLTVFGQAGMSGYEYKVTKDERNNLVLKYNEIHLGAGLRYKPNKYVNASLSAGDMLHRSIEYREDSLGKVIIKDGFYTELRTEIYF